MWPFFNPLVLKMFGAFLRWTKLRNETWPMIKDKSPIGVLGVTGRDTDSEQGFYSCLRTTKKRGEDTDIGPKDRRLNLASQTEAKGYFMYTETMPSKY